MARISVNPGSRLELVARVELRAGRVLDVETGSELELGTLLARFAEDPEERRLGWIRLAVTPAPPQPDNVGAVLALADELGLRPITEEALGKLLPFGPSLAEDELAAERESTVDTPGGNLDSLADDDLVFHENTVAWLAHVTEPIAGRPGWRRDERGREWYSAAWL